MVKTQPLVIPLNNGLTENTSDMDAAKPAISYCENLDFSKIGEVSCRPGFVDSGTLGLRTMSTTAGVVSTDNVTFQNSPYTPVSMFRYRDSRGERPGLMCRGRVFTKEDTNWIDRLYCDATRVDRVAEFVQYGDFTGALFAKDVTTACAYNFAHVPVGTVGTGTLSQQGCPLLGGVNPSVEAYVAKNFGANNFLYGGSADVSVGLDVYHCLVGTETTSADLILIVRKNNDIALTSFTISSVVVSQHKGEDPTCFALGSVLYVAYVITGGTSYQVRAINPITGATTIGAVSHSTTNSCTGLWLSARGTSVVVAHTTALASNVVTVTTYDSATLSVTHTGTFPATTATPNGPVVIGGGTGTTFVVSYVDNNWTVYVGTYVASTGTTAVIKTFFGGLDASVTGADITWNLLHQPISVNMAAPRTVIGLVMTQTNGLPTSSLPLQTLESTWYELDITDMLPDTGTTSAQLGTLQPGILAMGPVQGSALNFTAASCVTTVDGLTWRFPTLDFKNFSALGGGSVSYGLNQVSFINPSFDSIGEETVISGSVPHAIAGGYCFEVGFPMVSPYLSSGVTTGGLLVAGSYSLQAVWKWTDETGVVHRSAPSQLTSTVTTTSTNNQITGFVQNCQLTQREYQQVQIEVYCTDVNPTAVSPKYLAWVGSPTAGSRSTAYTVGKNGVVNGGPVVTTQLQLYTNAGAVLQNTPVSADGGCATVNRRMWFSDGRAVYASKLYRSDNNAPAWNDEGPLIVFPPTPAGRVLSLQALDDKLVILCERGVYVTYGDGPDDTGLGADFVTPYMVSALGISNERGAVVTSHGVAFHANKSGQAGASYGGIYLVDRSLGLNPISLPAMQEFVIQPPGPVKLAFVQERDLLVGYISQTTNLVAMDMRSGNWSVWTNPNGNAAQGTSPGTCYDVVGCAGLLWAAFINDGDEGLSALGVFSSANTAQDVFANSTFDIQTRLRTNHIYANGQDGLGWSHVRSATALGFTDSSSSIDISYLVIPDQTGFPMSCDFTFQAAGSDITWPRPSRIACEFRLGTQRCSEVQVEVNALPGLPHWSALRLDVIPTRVKAPAAQRA